MVRFGLNSVPRPGNTEIHLEALNKPDLSPREAGAWSLVSGAMTIQSAISSSPSLSGIAGLVSVSAVLERDRDDFDFFPLIAVKVRLVNQLT